MNAFKLLLIGSFLLFGLELPSEATSEYVYRGDSSIRSRISSANCHGIPSNHMNTVVCIPKISHDNRFDFQPEETIFKRELRWFVLGTVVLYNTYLIVNHIHSP